MADITVRKVVDTRNVQIAELRVPIDNVDEVRNALKTLERVRKQALAKLDVTGSEDEEAGEFVFVDYEGTAENGSTVSVVVRVASVDV